MSTNHRTTFCHHLDFFPGYLKNFLDIKFAIMIDFNASVIYFSSSSKLRLLKKQKGTEQGKKQCTQSEKKCTLNFEGAMN